MVRASGCLWQSPLRQGGGPEGAEEARVSKTIITAALTGVLATRKQCPPIPYRDEENARESETVRRLGRSLEGEGNEKKEDESEEGVLNFKSELDSFGLVLSIINHL